MNPRTEELRQLMVDHQLKAGDVARILNRGVQTVNLWRCQGASTERQTIPQHMLDLLKFRLQQRTTSAFDDLPPDQRRAALLQQGGEVMG